jgi:hypothetical protein
MAYIDKMVSKKKIFKWNSVKLDKILYHSCGYTSQFVSPTDQHMAAVNVNIVLKHTYRANKATFSHQMNLNSCGYTSQFVFNQSRFCENKIV